MKKHLITIVILLTTLASTLAWNPSDKSFNTNDFNVGTAANPSISYKLSGKVNASITNAISVYDMSRIALANIDSRLINYVDNTNGNDLTARSGDVTHPWYTFGNAVSNQPIGGAVVLTSNQTFIVDSQIFWTSPSNKLNIIGVGANSTGTSPNSNLVKQFSFTGPVEIWGLNADNSINWTTNMNVPNYIGTFSTAASNTTYVFHGCTMKAFADVWFQGGLGYNCQAYWVDGCVIATELDGLKFTMNNRSNCLGVVKDSTIMSVKYPGLNNTGTPGSMASGSRWIWQNVNVRLGDTSTGTPDTGFYFASGPAEASFSGVTFDYQGTNATFSTWKNDVATGTNTLYAINFPANGTLTSSSGVMITNKNTLPNLFLSVQNSSVSTGMTTNMSVEVPGGGLLGATNTFYFRNGLLINVQ